MNSTFFVSFTLSNIAFRFYVELLHFEKYLSNQDMQGDLTKCSGAVVGVGYLRVNTSHGHEFAISVRATLGTINRVESSAHMAKSIVSPYVHLLDTQSPRYAVETRQVDKKMIANATNNEFASAMMTESATQDPSSQTAFQSTRQSVVQHSTSSGVYFSKSIIDFGTVNVATLAKKKAVICNSTSTEVHFMDNYVVLCSSHIPLF